MTPSFIPVIGGGFDQIAGQQAGWAQFNRGVDEANLSRLAAAQQTRNNWLQQIQQIQQQQADRQAQVDQQAQNTDLALAQRAQQEAEARREFDVSAGIRRAAITAKADALTKAQQDANTQSDNFGTTTADELNDVATKVDRSLTEKTDAQAELAKKIADWNSKVPTNKVQLNRTGTMFVMRQGAGSLSPEEKSSVDQANSELADTYSALKDAETQHADSSKSFAQLVKEAEAYGLAARKNGDTWGLYHPQLNKWYLPKKKAVVTETSTEGFSLPPWASPGVAPSPFGNTPTVWPGFSDTTSGDAAAAPAQPQTFKVGRFTVAAQ